MVQSYHHGALHAALLAAAEVILERDGIAALSLRATAREAGVSHAAPAHHFASLSGLLSALAADGFVRLRRRLLDELQRVGPEPGQRRLALGRGYVGFARGAPGLFRLMFRSEQLDWSQPALAAAGAATFALLLPQGGGDGAATPPDQAGLGAIMHHWSSVHGLATLLVDGRFAAVADAILPGADIEALVDQAIGAAAG